MAELVLRQLVVRAGDRTLVDGVDLRLAPGELVGLVGASGSGKTLTCRALLGLVDLVPGVVSADLVVPTPGGPRQPYAACHGAGRRRRDRAFRGVRGDVVGFLPQQAAAALDPLLRVGAQVALAASLSGRGPSDPAAWLVRAGFPGDDAARVAELWPHQLSGGMAQRVVIAQALARGSSFLVADEPTTGLDAPIRQRLVRALRQLADDGLGVLMVTHDLALLAGVADRVQLMDAGRIVEHWDGPPQAATSEPGRRLLAAASRRPW